MADELLKHLYDMREATAAIFRFIRGKTCDDYEQDELLRNGIERKFEIIGEALNRIRRDDLALLDKIREHRMGWQHLPDGFLGCASAGL